jgi:hypothetical protein
MNRRFLPLIVMFGASLVPAAGATTQRLSVPTRERPGMETTTRNQNQQSQQRTNQSLFGLNRSEQRQLFRGLPEDTRDQIRSQVREQPDISRRELFRSFPEDVRDRLQSRLQDLREARVGAQQGDRVEGQQTGDQQAIRSRISDIRGRIEDRIAQLDRLNGRLDDRFQGRDQRDLRESLGNRIDRLQTLNNRLDDRFNRLNDRLNDRDQRSGQAVENGFDRLQRLNDRLDTRLDRLNDRFNDRQQNDRQGGQGDRVQARTEAQARLQTRVDRLQTLNDRLDDRFDRREGRTLGNLSNDVRVVPVVPRVVPVVPRVPVVPQAVVPQAFSSGQSFQGTFQGTFQAEPSGARVFGGSQAFGGGAGIGGFAGVGAGVGVQNR